MSKLLYHYCSVETFFQIIKNQTLRLTNIQYMNDAEELHYGMDLLGEAEDKYKIEKKFRYAMRIYAMCFCEERDLLSQWRGYGDNAEGVSIGFDFSILKDTDIFKDKNSGTEYFHSLQQVLYNRKKQQQQINEAIEDKNEFPNQDYRILAKKWGELISSLKNTNFKEEKEWRFISGVSKIGNSNKTDKSLSFCVTNKKLVPYIDRKFEDVFKKSEKTWSTSTKVELDDAKHKHSPIKKIIIGSSCKLDEITIKEFLSHYGIYYVEIEKSKLSYRAK